MKPRPKIKIINHRGGAKDASWWVFEANAIAKQVDSLMGGLEDKIYNKEGHGPDADRILEQCRRIVRAQV